MVFAKVFDFMYSGKEMANVSLWLSVMKPLSAQWLMEFQEYMNSHPIV